MDNYAYQPDGNNENNENSGRAFAITRYPTARNGNEYLVEVNSRAKIFKKPAFYKRMSAVLLILAILLLIGLITIIILYTRTKPKICVTDECLRTASNLKYSLDLSVDPCNNFYEYTCGKWSQEHPNHGWWSTFSSFSTISERVALATLDILTSTASSVVQEPEAVQKSKDFYKSCMDGDTLDELGLTPMYEFIKMVGLPVVPSYFTIPNGAKDNFTFNWMKTETLIKRVIMLDVFIGFDVDANIFNGTENVLYVGKLYQRSPLPSPAKKRRAKLRSELASEDSVDLARTVSSNIIKYVLKEVVLNFTGALPDDNRLQEATDVILNMTDYIDELNANFTDPDESEDDAFTITFGNLQSLSDSFSNDPHPDLWINYFNYLFSDTNVTIDPKKDLLYVTELDKQYVLRILKYVLGSSDLYVELYMWWVTVYAMIINTSSDMVDYVSRQFAYLGSSGSDSIARSRSLECALLVKNYMGFAVSYVLADQSFPVKTKPKVERMIRELKQAFVEHVNSIHWMDKQTKKVTLEKSREMLSFIGYPEWLFQKGELDEYYKDVIIKPDTYLGNMISIIISHTTRKRVSLRMKHERDWYTEPVEVNAFNSFSDNAINVPMAILSFPMYNLGLEVLNYGSIGSILGHELTHGFDNLGRKHDKYGNYVQWWSNKTIETFQNLTECFINQYDNFTIEGVEGHVKGKATLAENLADNGGLNQAFSAYKKYVKSSGDEQILPGFENFTSYQLFFIAYGSIWCETTTQEDLKDQLENDEHCPNAIRVIGTLQNSEEFSKAFHCRKGSFMNPQKKCKIW